MIFDVRASQRTLRADLVTCAYKDLRPTRVSTTVLGGARGDRGLALVRRVRPDFTLERDRADGRRNGIVTALHEVPYGEVWSRARPSPGPEGAHSMRQGSTGPWWKACRCMRRIKRGEGDLVFAVRQLPPVHGQSGGGGHQRTICYNFMPLLDWTRTDLAAPVAARRHLPAVLGTENGGIGDLHAWPRRGAKRLS
jgi:hypothetical protein